MSDDKPYLEDGGIRRYFVVCTQGAPHWWDLFFKYGFTHAYLLIWHDPLWLCVNPTHNITQVFTIPCYEWREPRELIDDPHATIYETRIRSDERFRAPWMWAPITCTEIVKSTLGIRRFWLWTPYQLAKYLRAEHG